jgi:GTPase involved in cell partitioning and DNA repair
MVEIPTAKPYIFMIRVTRQMKCLIAHAPGVIPHPLPEVNFLIVEIPTPKPYIFMIRVNTQIKFLIAEAPGVIPHPYLK